jgi:hypothetical protein
MELNLHSHTSALKHRNFTSQIYRQLKKKAVPVIKQASLHEGVRKSWGEVPRIYNLSTMEVSGQFQAPAAFSPVLTRCGWASGTELE